MRRILSLLATLWLLSCPGSAFAHDFEPGVLVLVETSPHRYDVAWSAPIDSSGAPAGVELDLPAACTYAGDTLDCGTAPLAGTIRFHGMHASRMQVVVIVEWASGERLERIVTGARPELAVGAPVRDGRGFFVLGIEHIATGLDHIAFLVGLLLVVGFDGATTRARIRRVVATITAFTLAHSLTLGLAATRLLLLPSRPVEATIAASVVLVAREGLQDRETAVRRYPWLVAAIFGLVHGLGFAGALADLGLPQSSRPLALLLFNLGVEVGQLAIVLVCFLAAAALARVAARLRLRAVLCYTLGGAGALFCIERVAAMVAR